MSKLILHSAFPLALSAIADLPSGCSLAGDTPKTIGIAIIAFGILSIVIAIVYFGNRRNRRSALPLGSTEHSSIALTSYNTPRGEEPGHEPYYNEGQPANERGFI